MRRLSLNLNLTGVIVILAVGVLLPVMLATATGIVALVFAKDTSGIVTGVLVVCFAVAAAGSGLVALVFVGSKARLASQQADFIANVSHELRTPLSAIRLYAQTLQSDRASKDPERFRKCVDAIVRETSWLDVMIEKVLTWRASSKDMMCLNMEERPLTDAVTGAAERFRGMCESEEFSLSLDITGRQTVMHDPQAIHLVVLNLLTNAYKYSGEKKSIFVRLKDDGDNAVIEVEDNGMGMTRSEIKLAFQPFYRGGSDSHSGGVGLGLAIAKHIVNTHKGELSISSERGAGSVFTITLPAVIGDEP